MGLRRGSAWRGIPDFPDPVDAPADQELLAVGRSLESTAVLEGYCRGLFPMPLPDQRAGWPRRRAAERSDEPTVGWWSPNPRGVLRLDRLHISRSLRRSMRGFNYSVDDAFAEVVRGCADPTRPHAWIDDAMLDLYLRLHQLGFAHSVEVWRPDDPTLAGGLFGVEIGGLFAAESMFHRRTDASKAAVAHLVSNLVADGADRLVDVQWLTPHLASLGAVSVSRPRYLELLGDALELEPRFVRKT